MDMHGCCYEEKRPWDIRKRKRWAMGSFELQNKIAVFGIIINSVYGAAGVMYALHSNHDDCSSHAVNGGFPTTSHYPMEFYLIAPAP